MAVQTEAVLSKTLKRVGIAADHGGFELKEFLAGKLREAGYEVSDFGDRQLKSDDDYPDYIIPLALAVAAGTVDRGIGICGSGVGVSIAANKVAGVRAGLIDENFSAHQGVEDDDLNMICFGGLLIGHALAWELAQTFLAARFKGAKRFRRRLAKVAQLGWPDYWSGQYAWGANPYIERDRNKWGQFVPGAKAWDRHLRSTHAVSGYHVGALDGDIGHVEDFIVHDETWTFRYLIVNTGSWWPGKKVLVSRCGSNALAGRNQRFSSIFPGRRSRSRRNIRMNRW